MKGHALVCVLLLSSVPAVAYADDPPPLPAAPAAPEPIPVAMPAEAPRQEFAPRNDFLRISGGVRVNYVTSSGYDTFASNDALGQFSLEGSYAFLSSSRFSLAAGGAWDVGGRASGLRGTSSSLTLHRLSAPLEGRVHVSRAFYGFVRVAPGAAAILTSVGQQGGQRDLEGTAWVFAADASVGTSILLGPRKETEKRSPRVWLTPEFGYSFATEADIKGVTRRDDPLGSDERTNFGTLALNGVFWRVSAAITY